MNKQELIKRIEDLKNLFGNKTKYIAKDEAIKLIEQLDEPKEKVTLPRPVANWISCVRGRNKTLHFALENAPEEVNLWFCEDEKNRQNIFANAWVNGYHIEKENWYEVILCNGQSLKTVYRQGEDRLDFEKVYGDLERFTRKQLKKAGFGWVFDCPGIEIKEVN